MHLKIYLNIDLQIMSNDTITHSCNNKALVVDVTSVVYRMINIRLFTGLVL